jgi:hypothetical protein
VRPRPEVERVVVLLRVLPVRDFAAPEAPRVDFAAPPVPRELPVVDEERVEPVPDDFARLEAALRVDPVLLLRPVVLLPAVLRELLDLPALEREELDRPPDDLAPLLRDEPLKPDDEPSSPPHLPDITRCAASATASAMIEPRRVALETMLLAALDAVSAASRPASRILRRAAGLALIAAAAAARPAASISLLIAALASLSTVVSSDFFDLAGDLAEVVRVDLAIAFLPPLRGKDT